ncbi:hypothetical protein [Demequina sp.]|uniref:hypothetical protein n=1 Tax=Demequina sp. TaxID=2050685 RepID=UPI0025BA09A4|nr:hypothetical protein [Demequina sp.]
MNSKYAPIAALTVLGIVVILVVGWFVLISPQLSTASDLRSTRDKVEANTATIVEETTKLSEYEASFEDGIDLSETIAQNLPSEVDVQAMRSRVLTSISGSKMEISNLEFGASFPVEGWEVETRGLTSSAIARLFQTGPVPIAGIEPPASDAEELTLNEAGDYVPPVSATRAAGPLVDSLFGTPISILATGTYAEAEQLLARLQDSEQQLFLVHDLTITARNEGAPAVTGVADAKDGDVIVNVTGAFYYLNPSTAVEDEPWPGPIGAQGAPFVPGDGAEPQSGAS